MSADLTGVRHVVLDMDGTIYRGSHLFSCTLPFLQGLSRLGIGYSFLTNNSSRSKADYCSKLREFGLPARLEQIYTSADCALDYLQTTLPAARRIALVGTPSLCAEFAEAGYTIDWDAPDVVLVGFDTTLTYARLCRAAYWISKDLPFIATHPDFICPTDQPTVLVDCGSICACLHAATGRRPIMLGKPSPSVLRQICSRHALDVTDVVMVGDRLYTDMAMAREAGCISVLVLTGEATRAESLEMKVPPDLVLEDVGALGILLDAAHAPEVTC